jgi:Beta-lactamase enzyme family
LPGGERGLRPAERLRFHAERAPVSDPTVDEAVGLMMQLSDNAATSALIQHVEHDRIMARLAALGLPHTTIGPEDVIADIERITATLDRLAQQVGFAAWQEPASTVQAGGYPSIEGLLMQIPTDERSLPDTLLGPTTTARESASLWAMVWRDEAGPPAACARVRTAAGQQRLNDSNSDSTPTPASASRARAAPSPASSTTKSVSSPSPTDAATPPACTPAPRPRAAARRLRNVARSRDSPTRTHPLHAQRHYRPVQQFQGWHVF